MRGRCERSGWIGAVLAGLLAAAPLAFASDGDFEKVIGFRVGIDASGQVRTALPTNASLPLAVNQAAAGLTRQLHFVPARVDGASVPSETTVRLTVRFLAQPGGGYRLALRAARQTLQGLEMPAPPFPAAASSQDVGARVVTFLAVDANGRVDMAHSRIESLVLTRPDPELERDFRTAVLQTVQRWRFGMDTVAGRPQPASVHLPTNFCMPDDAECIAELDAAAPMHDLHDPAVPANVQLPVLQPLAPPATPAAN